MNRFKKRVTTRSLIKYCALTSRRVIAFRRDFSLKIRSLNFFKTLQSNTGFPQKHQV